MLARRGSSAHLGSVHIVHVDICWGPGWGGWWRRLRRLRRRGRPGAAELRGCAVGRGGSGHGGAVRHKSRGCSLRSSVSSQHMPRTFPTLVSGEGLE